MQSPDSFVLSFYTSIISFFTFVIHLLGVETIQQNFYTVLDAECVGKLSN